MSALAAAAIGALVALHVVAAVVALVHGWVALYARKGARRHRRSGTAFVGAMLVMAISGAVLGAVRGEALNVLAGAVTTYLVTTGWTTVRSSPRSAPGPIDAWAPLAATTIGCLGIGHGWTLASTDPDRAAFFVFGTVALLGAAGDLHRIGRGIGAVARVARHLWRMGAALLIATSSLFLGRSTLFPPAVRKPAILAIPELVVLLTVVYWLVRIAWSAWSRRAVRSDAPGDTAIGSN